MITKPISIDEAKRVLFNSELFNRLSNGKGRHEIKFKKGLYIGGFVGGSLKCVGMIYDHINYQSIHVNIIKKHRAKLGVIFGKNLLKYTLDKPIVTNIPERFDDVRRFAEYFGFKVAGKRNGDLIYIRG